MPREVFAEEIEHFLATLDGVGSARVLTTPAGEIAQIYVTADSLADGQTVRRSVAVALASTYGLPVEPWRIQVTQLRAGLRPAEIPQFRLVRVEETVSQSETAVAVRLAWIRGGEERTAIGRARGSGNPAARARILAAATVDAARAVFDAAHRRITVEQVSLQTLMDRPVALVGISVSTPRGPEIVIGAAPHDDRAPDAVILAALDAVTKWLLKIGFVADAAQEADRRAQLDAMRHFMRSAERGGVVAVPEHSSRETGEEAASQKMAAPANAGPKAASLEAAAAATLGPSAAPLGTVAPAHNGPEATVPEPPLEAALTGSPVPGTASQRPDRGVVWPPAPEPSKNAAMPGEGIPDDPDVLKDLSQIRPEKKGGAEMAMRQEPSRGGIVQPRAGRPSMEDAFYQALVEERTPVHLRCRDGYEIPHAVVKDVGTYTLLLETGGGTELIYKHAIISIRPLTSPTAEA